MSEYGIIYFYPYILYNKIGHCGGEHIYRCSDLLKNSKKIIWLGCASSTSYKNVNYVFS